jgi:hypothetical protein
LRALRVAAPVQLSLSTGSGEGDPAGRWWRLPEPTRAEVVVLLARLIARGALVDDGQVGDGGRPQRREAGRG